MGRVRIVQSASGDESQAVCFDAPSAMKEGIMRITESTWLPTSNLHPSMLRHLWVGLLALFLVGCAAGIGERASQPCPSPVSAPTLQVGDTWRWQDEKGRQLYLRYIGRTDEGLLEREDRPRGARLFYDDTHTLRKVFHDGLWITQPNVAYPDIGQPQLEFPLQPGKTWSKLLLAREAGSYSARTYSQRFTVLGCEQVAVPAGTFPAVVIEEEQGVSGTATGGFRTWWYAPDVKYLVKLAHGRASHPGYWSAFYDWALTSYQLASGPVTQPRAAPSTPPAPSRSPVPPPSAPEVAKAVPSSVMVPIWERGYEWKFRWSSPRGSGTYVRTVVGEEVVGGVAHYVMKTGTRDIYYTKDELAWLMDRVEGAVETRASPADRGLAWPLEVGKEWEEKYSWENPGQRTTEDRVRRFKVEALEAVHVPAGSFQAFHLVARDPTGRITHEYWYSPEVKWLVKEKMYFSYGVQDRELLEYKLTPTVAPLPATGSGR